MRKTLLYLVILGLLGFAVYYFLIADNKNETPFAANEAGFSFTDTGSIGKFFIASTNGKSVLMERDTVNGGWRVNKDYKALQSSVNLVLTTLATQQALYPVTAAAYENVIKTLSAHNVKVELYGRDGKKLRVFYVGGAAVNNSGTNMLMEGAKQPFVVQTPGFNGALTSRYPYDIMNWRDRTVFAIPQAEVKSISLQYADNPINSFAINRTGDTEFVMTADKSIASMGDYNKRRAKVYTRYFAEINCEGYLNGLQDMDSTLRVSHPYAVLEVTGMHGQHQRAEMYWMEVNKRSKNRSTKDPDIPDQYDPDRLYAVINDRKDTVLLQRWAFRDVFHKAFEFYQKDVEPTKPQPYERPKNVIMQKEKGR